MSLPVILSGLATADDDLGTFEPPSLVGAEDLRKFAPDQIFRFSAEVSPSSAAASACVKTLAATGLAPSDIDCVISCTATPDFNNPGLVSLLLHRLGIRGIPGLEIKQLTCGPLYAIDLAAKMVASKRFGVVLVAATELLSRYFADAQQRSDLSPSAATARAVFGDGAASCVVTTADRLPRKSPSYSVGRIWLGASGFGQGSLLAKLPCAGRVPSRLDAEDLSSGAYYPEVSTVGWNKDAVQATQPLASELAKFEDLSSSIIVTHQLFRGALKPILSEWGLAEDRIVDNFVARGFLGAAGILSVMADAARAQSVNRRLLAIAESGATQWAIGEFVES